MKKDWTQIGKSAVPHVLAILALVVLNLILFSPQFQGKQLRQNDILQGQAMQGEILEYEKKKNQDFYWNNSMFAGMPWDMLVYGTDQNKLRFIRPLTRLFQTQGFGMFFALGILTYISLVLLGVRPSLAFLGASVMVLNVNHIVLLEAGHNNKIRAIAFFPLIFAGLVMALQKGAINRQLFGAMLMAVGVSLSISENHPQMLYYFLLAVAIWFLIRLATGYREIGNTFFRGLGFLVIGFGLAVASNMTQINGTLKVAENSMRGEPILQDESNKNASGSSSTVDGLNWDYAMQWSNAFRDVYSLFIPRAVGGSSAEEISTTTQTGRILRQNNAAVGRDGNVQGPMYWGGLPFTSGPYYIGAIVFFLFVLSFFVLKPPYRWGFGIMFALLVLMSLGKNFEGFNRFLFDHFPFYNKFRAPNSVLHATAFLLVVPAILTVREFIHKKDELSMKKTLLPAVAISAGLCLFFAVLGGSLFDFDTASDVQRYGQNPQFLDLLREDRQLLLRQDAFRSLLFILAAFGLLWAFAQKYIKSIYVVIIGLVLLNSVDLYSVARRYLDEDNWQRRVALEASFPERDVDRQIRQMENGKRYNYRVLDLSINTFNSAYASLYHNTIGGYNAAKPQRIQDLIDYYIGVGQPDMNVLNMLNTKYIIQPGPQVQQNPGALGNAWFVNNVVSVNSPNEEIEKLGEINPANTAVLNKSDFSGKNEELKGLSGNGTIRITSYVPDRIVYESLNQGAGLAVFSESWYPDGWSATIDGESVPILRVNYLLRALAVPAGRHEIVFEYQPPVNAAGMTTVASIVLLLLFFGSAGWYAYAQYSSNPTVVSADKTKAPTSKGKRKKSKRSGKKS